jgi:exopolysaccharide biosynthesis protein
MKSAAPYLSILILVLSVHSSHTAGQTTVAHKDSITFIRIESDSIFDSPQQISLLILNKKAIPPYRIDIVSPVSALLKTSELGKSEDAVAAVNGNFFDMDHGGSVSYVEKGDSVLSRTRAPDQKWAVADSIINAALVLDTSQHIRIEPKERDQYYERSEAESFVLLSGPLLLKDSLPQPLPHLSFTHKRHPRTCVGITKETIIFITIDGRSERAAGMNLPELQLYLQELGCLDAINLDGGGSTTMWIRDRGIVNEPSDKNGERSVANALLILKD